MKKGKKNGGKLHKNRERGLKNASFWGLNYKNFRGERFSFNCTLSLIRKVIMKQSKKLHKTGL